MKDRNKWLNYFATRCFRNTADHDYIAARMCYRAGLISQFHWAALQAFEKYYKGILLFNRIEATDVRHNLAKTQHCAERLPFEIKLNKSSRGLLDHLNEFGPYRYLESSYFIRGPKLGELDQAVWELRRYCQVIEDPQHDIQSIEEAANRPPQAFSIGGGTLEEIINNPMHPARAPLIWQNGYYGTSRRRQVKIPVYSHMENSPLSLNPQLLEHVCKYVYIPPKIADLIKRGQVHFLGTESHYSEGR